MKRLGLVALLGTQSCGKDCSYDYLMAAHEEIYACQEFDTLMQTSKWGWRHWEMYDSGFFCKPATYCCYKIDECPITFDLNGHLLVEDTAQYTK